MTLIPAQRGSELHSLFWITSFCLPADSLGWPRSLHCCGCLGHFRSALLLFSTSKGRRLVSEGGPPRLSVRNAFSKCFASPYSVSAKRQKVTSRDTKIKLLIFKCVHIPKLWLVRRAVWCQQLPLANCEILSLGTRCVWGRVQHAPWKVTGTIVKTIWDFKLKTESCPVRYFFTYLT